MAMGAAENSKRSARKKVPGRPFTKGQSGNPGGRPRALGELKAQCREMTPAILEQLRAEAADRSTDHWFDASKLIIAYGWGRPASAEEDRDALAQASRPLASVSPDVLREILELAPEDDEPGEG